ncbi:MAG: sulfurtransferase TusA family protein [Firmicutes bacterium HGW-Firmicutes-5]|uniref:sulfurtransferase TusA family protein n=1 Tax=Petrocella atlantisensis TaxID=2173034 RepID=UPI000CB9E1DF|nr:sulfurtransferase TusA family protein [Petrocella atlantisensis]PKM55738.1 MAG: sulfurtransferase TusA family protein [Firmicutes bacterium HGW-Firmicutes-5]
MEKVNCFGDFCPIPLLKARKSFDQLAIGESFMLVSDHSCTVDSIEEYFAHRPCSISVDEPINGVYEITLTKL